MICIRSLFVKSLTIGKLLLTRFFHFIKGNILIKKSFSFVTVYLQNRNFLKKCNFFNVLRHIFGVKFKLDIIAVFAYSENIEEHNLTLYKENRYVETFILGSGRYGCYDSRCVC